MDKLYERLCDVEYNLRLRISREFVKTLIEHKNFVPQQPNHRIEIAERVALKLRELTTAQKMEQEQKERTKRDAMAATASRKLSYDEELIIVRASFERALAMQPKPRGYALEKVTRACSH